ncbi:hypothetical protein PGT21_032077 [Puccinia graminis f. sp. tritici]|uniref:Uncharacterized protein n=1 Tax=Puccinia graminis f. sp. tritici TaxID=56615 RepID=A0A5B0NAV9_PUCGR|nr:hypothetical protein PGT21_032077 [Puccinia graminis f. sp. tritici]KAA1086331.1 hypothetical protein PGTUg99_013259 [Puccinia graminis f. sp. tritici]
MVERLILLQISILEKRLSSHEHTVVNKINEFLYLVQREMFPGIMEEKLSQIQQDSEQFEDYFELQIHSYEFKKWWHIARDYSCKLVKTWGLNNSDPSMFDPKVYEEYARKLAGIWDDFRKKYHSVFEKPASILRQFQDANHDIEELISHGEVYFMNMKQRIF